MRATVGTCCALDPGFLEMGSICLKAEGVALLILSQFHRIFKNGDREGVRANSSNGRHYAHYYCEPTEPYLDPPLNRHCKCSLFNSPHVYNPANNDNDNSN